MVAHHHEETPSRETIAALSTAPGKGAIAIVRISGPGAKLVFHKIFTAKNGAEDYSDRKMILGQFLGSDNQPIDEGMGVLMNGPRSYTGEDMAELYCHGGPAIVQALLSAAVEAGARPAAPGEFTRRAFLEGKIDLVQCESVADLISAETQRAAQAALSQLEGGLSEALEKIWEKIVDVGAHLEAAIDFPDEFEPGAGPTLTGGPMSEADLAGRFGEIVTELKQLEATYRSGRILREGARVAILGPPNAGKSTLLNRLLGADRAIISPTPGTTRDTVEDVCDINGIPVRIIDTAGLRSTGDPIEKEGTERARRAAADADLCLLMVDATDKSAEFDLSSKEFESLKNISMVVANKMDLPGAKLPEILNGFGDIFGISALTGEGVESLRSSIGSLLMGEAAGDRSGDQRVLTRERHRDLVAKCRQAIERALKMTERSVSPELVAVDLNDAQRALSDLLGKDYGEELLDKIFSTFCIGK